jgi:hypothetical protein
LVVIAHELRRVALDDGEHRLRLAVARYLLELVTCNDPVCFTSSAGEGVPREECRLVERARAIRHRASCADVKGSEELADRLVALGLSWCGGNAELSP